MRHSINHIVPIHEDDLEEDAAQAIDQAIAMGKARLLDHLIEHPTWKPSGKPYVNFKCSVNVSMTVVIPDE